MNAYVTSLLMAATAYFFVSTGIILQKKGILWIGWKGKKDKSFYSSLFVWLSGFLLMNIYGVPSAIALKFLPPHIVSAFAGFGIIIIVYFSNIFLKERIYKTDYVYSMLIVTGIVILCVSGNGDLNHSVNRGFLSVVFFALPILFFLVLLRKGIGDKYKNVFHAVISGCSAGVMVVALKGLVHNFGYVVADYFSSEFLYIYIVFAILSFISLQISLKNGPALVTGQIQYSFTIIYPVIGSLTVFSEKIGVFQLFSVLLIVYCVMKMFKNR